MQVWLLLPFQCQSLNFGNLYKVILFIVSGGPQKSCDIKSDVLCHEYICLTPIVIGEPLA